jgi:putative ABC transport system ATP-binding protein
MQQPENHMPPVLVMEAASKYREQGGVAFELQVPEFSLRQGQFFGLVGESGCGKSTLLDMLALVLRPTSCDRFQLYLPSAEDGVEPVDIKSLWENNEEARLARLRRNHLGYILQSGGLLPFLTVRQNIRLPWRIKDKIEKHETFRMMTSKMGVDALLSKKPQYLSGGQRQRIAILRAMVHQPMLILADEPTAAVDTQRARIIVKDFHALAKANGNTIVMVTHNLRLIEPVADSIYTYKVSEITKKLTRSVCVPYE